MGSEKQNDSLFESLPGEVRHMRECPLCGAQYPKPAAEVLFRESGVHLVHITCSACAGKVLNIVALSPIGMSSVGLFTDLSADDTVRFYEKEPISEDDVLAFHKAVHTNSKEISKLFQ